MSHLRLWFVALGLAALGLLVWQLGADADDGSSPEAIAASQTTNAPAVARTNEAASSDPTRAPDSKRTSYGETPAPQAEAEAIEDEDAAAQAAAVCLAVRCVDASGEGIARCALRLSRFDGAPLGEPVSADLRGAAELRIADTSGGLIVVAEDAARGLSSGSRWLMPHEFEAYRCGAGVLELILLPQVTVHGVVWTTAGEPVTDATVELDLTEFQFGGAGASPTDPTVTDDRGRFAFTVDGLSAAWRLRATTEDAASAWRALRLPDDADEEQVLLVHRARYRVDGVLLAPPGCDLATGIVVLVPEEPDLPSVTASCNAKGEFHLELERPTSFRLAARAEGHLSGAPSAGAVSDESPAAWVELPLEAASFIAGRVLDGAGEPRPGIGLVTSPSASTGEADWCLDTKFRQVTASGLVESDEEGRFRFEGLHRDYVYRVDAFPDPARMDYRTWTHDVSAGTDDLVIVLDADDLQGATLQGEVRYSGRDPYPRSLFVQLGEWREGSKTWVGGPPHTVPIEGGRYRIERLVIGRRYVADFHLPGVRCAPVWPGPWTATAEPTTVDLAFGSDGGARVALTTPDGAPARGWFVDLQPEGESQPTRLSFSVGEDGVADVKPLAEGVYALHARRGETRLGPFRVDIVGGETIQMSVDVE